MPSVEPRIAIPARENTRTLDDNNADRHEKAISATFSGRAVAGAHLRDRRVARFLHTSC